MRSDADISGTVNLTDGIKVLNALFRGDTLECSDSADVDDSGAVNLTDAVRIFQWLFRGGEIPLPSPTAPGYDATDCGRDPTEDNLECEQASPTCSE